MDWLILIIGLVVLLAGADFLVRGGLSLARRFQISPRVIGLTIIALGTSLPELALNVVAALRGDTDIIFANLIGSNIFNVGLVVGLGALIRAASFEQAAIRREIPMMVAVTLLAVGVGHDQLWFRSQNVITQIDGVLLLLAFVVFVVLILRSGRQCSASSKKIELRMDDRIESTGREQSQSETAHGGAALKKYHWPVALLMILIGSAGVLGGSDLAVEGATRVAERLGVSQALIGLTILAVGTSLPELATSVIAAIKGHVELALGNAIGSNIVNLALILGISAVVGVVPVPALGLLDLWVMLGFALAFWAAAGTAKSKLTRVHGLGLVTGYVIFIAFRVGLSLQ